MKKTEETRIRILTEGMHLIRKNGIAATGMADVAAAAQVTRQTVYFHFRGRAGLLEEIVRFHDINSVRGRTVFAATRIEPAAAALDSFVRAWFAYLPEVLPVVRELQSLAATDRDVRASWLNRQDELKAMAATVLARLRREGHMRGGWTVEKAAEWLCAQLFPSQWQGLVVERKWKAAEFVDRVAASVNVVLVNS